MPPSAWISRRVIISDALPSDDQQSRIFRGFMDIDIICIMLRIFVCHGGQTVRDLFVGSRKPEESRACQAPALLSDEAAGG